MGDVKSISRRTFQRDINEIRSLFNIDIQCNKNGQYYIEEDDFSGFNNRIIEGFDLFSTLSAFQKKSSMVLLEDRCSIGTEHLFGILHAIENNFILKFTHNKYWEDKITERKVKPYALKESKSRWYVLAEDMGDGKMKTFGLDRISNLEITSKRFIPNTTFNPEEYFKNSYGVITRDDVEIEEVILSFTETQSKYVKSFPLHHSQEEIEPIDGEYTIKLILRPTFDFKREILSHGDKVRVHEPESLKGVLKEILLKSMNNLK